MNNIVNIMSWSKQNAIEYCKEVAKLSINVNCKEPKVVLETYQNILFPHREHSFYARLWKETVINSLNRIAHDRFEDKEVETAFTCLNEAFKNQDEPENLEQFIDNITSIQSYISRRADGDVKLNFIAWCMDEIGTYILKQLDKLYKKEISGPECLMRYVYPYASCLILPNEDRKLRWLFPSIKSIHVGLNAKPNKDTPFMCSFCGKQEIANSFASQCTQYTYGIFVTCKDCSEFRDYYNTCYLNVDNDVIDIPITVDKKLDLSCFEKK